MLRLSRLGDGAELCPAGYGSTLRIISVLPGTGTTTDVTWPWKLHATGHEPELRAPCWRARGARSFTIVYSVFHRRTAQHLVHQGRVCITVAHVWAEAPLVGNRSSLPTVHRGGCPCKDSPRRVLVTQDVGWRALSSVRARFARHLAGVARDTCLCLRCGDKPARYSTREICRWAT